MSNTYRYILLWVSVAALMGSAILATTPAVSRAQLTWQGSYLTTPRAVGEPRLLQGHGAAPEALVLLSPESNFLLQFALGVFLILLGFALHALFLSSRDRAVPVRVRSVPRRRVMTYYWYRMRV